MAARSRSAGTAKCQTVARGHGGRATGTSTSRPSDPRSCIDSRLIPASTWRRNGRRMVARSPTCAWTGQMARSGFESCRRSEVPIARSVTSPSFCLPPGLQTASTWWQRERALRNQRARHGVYAIPIGGGAPRAITRARPSGQDMSAVLSADGRRLAYVACPGPGPDSDCHLQVVKVARDSRRLVHHDG